MPSVTLRIFLSSTWLDLQPERAAIEKALQRMDIPKFIGMEHFGSRNDTTRAVSLKEVERSQLYVGIFGGRYGSGITEDEYRRARERGLQCFIYCKDESTITQIDEEPEKQAKLQALKRELRQQHLISAPFTNPDELATQVATDLHNWIVNDFLPAQQQTLEYKALHQLPAPPADLTGREEELAALRANSSSRGVTISGLQGLGGVVKRVVCPCCGVIINVNALDRQGETNNYCPKCEARVWIETEDDSAIVAIVAQANEQKKTGEVPWRLLVAVLVVFLIFVFYLISLRATP